MMKMMMINDEDNDGNGWWMMNMMMRQIDSLLLVNTIAAELCKNFTWKLQSVKNDG